MTRISGRLQGSVRREDVAVARYYDRVGGLRVEGKVLGRRDRRAGHRLRLAHLRDLYR